VAKYLGPSEYGKFALSIAVMTSAALAFEWIRQCGVRFYSERSRREAQHVAPRSTPPSPVLCCCFSHRAGDRFLGPEFSLPRNLWRWLSPPRSPTGCSITRRAGAARFDDRLFYA